MYHQKPQGWFKHIDFILWDVLCLHLAFVLAYITRHGWENPYGNRIYFNIIFVYSVVDLIILIVNHTLKSVLKRGFGKEFAQTLKHTCLMELIIFLYLLISVHLFKALQCVENPFVILLLELKINETGETTLRLVTALNAL